MEQTFKKLVSDFESLHRSAILGSSNKLFSDPAEKSIVAQFWTKLRKDKDSIDSSLLSQISAFALNKAKCLWQDVYSDSIFDPFITYCAQLYGIPKARFSNYPTNFPVSALPKTASLPAYQPSQLTTDLRQKDSSAKSQVSDSKVDDCIFSLLSTFLYLCVCKLQAVAIEKAASQLSIHIPILTFFIEGDDREELAKRTFLAPVPLDSDMNLWVGQVWKKL